MTEQSKHVETLSPGVHGRLTILKLWDDGVVETALNEGDNLVTKAGKGLLLSNLFRADGGSGDPLLYAKIGTGGTTDPTGLLVRTPSDVMTDLFTPRETVSIIKVTQDLAVPSITLAAFIDQSQGNGLKITEAGFFSNSGIMFNIKTFTGIDKLSSFALMLKWTIQIV